jgi:hypothetical protein
MDPTSRGDCEAALLRRWYEAHRETWGQRLGLGADRRGGHSDEWMLRFMGEARRLGRLSDNRLMQELG